MCRLFLGLLLVVTVAGLYTEADEGVTILTADNFEKTVVETDGLFIVEFYAPWCGHCKSLTPEWLKLAKAMKGIAGVGVLDMTKYSVIGEKYGVTGFPTIKIFGADKSKPTNFEGDRTATKFAAGVINEFRAMLRSRLGVKAPKSAKKEASGEAKKAASGEERKEAGEAKKAASDGGSPDKTVDDSPVDDSPDKTVALTDADFDEKVVQSDQLWIVEFFAPWCGHCKKLVPEWKKAAHDLDGQVNFGTVDCTQQSKLKDEYQIRSFPTIKVFSNDKSQPLAFEALRQHQHIVTEAKNFLRLHNTKPKPVVQLTGDSALTEYCPVTSGSLCAVVFLPHILDTGAEGRNKILGDLDSLSKKFKRSKIGFMWAEGFTHQKLEAAFEVGQSGYPAMVMMNRKKNRYVPFLGSFSQERVSEFLDGVFSGSERTIPMPKIPDLEKVEAWNGKDGEAPKGAFKGEL